MNRGKTDRTQETGDRERHLLRHELRQRGWLAGGTTTRFWERADVIGTSICRIQKLVLKGRCRRRCRPGLRLVSQQGPTGRRQPAFSFGEGNESRNMGSLARQTPPVSADDDWCLLKRTSLHFGRSLCPARCLAKHRSSWA